MQSLRTEQYIYLSHPNGKIESFYKAKALPISFQEPKIYDWICSAVIAQYQLSKGLRKESILDVRYGPQECA